MDEKNVKKKGLYMSKEKKKTETIVSRRKKAKHEKSKFGEEEIKKKEKTRHIQGTEIVK